MGSINATKGKVAGNELKLSLDERETDKSRRDDRIEDQ
jgi:hypothetical protein